MSDTTISIDARGQRCPRPIIELAKARRRATVGAVIRIVADDLAFESDVMAWCQTTGNEITEMTRDECVITVMILVRTAAPNASTVLPPPYRPAQQSGV